MARRLALAAMDLDPRDEGTGGGGDAPPTGGGTPTPGCQPVTSLSSDPWIKWCREGGACNHYGGRWDVCETWVPIFAPWTDAGKAARWATKLKPEDYDAEKIVVIRFTDPLKFAWMSLAAPFVIPVLGAAYMSSFVIGPGIVAGYALALQRGGPDRLWNNVIRPIIDYQKDFIWAIAPLLGGNTVPFIQLVLRKEAERDRYSATTRGIMMGLAEGADVIAQLASNPATIKEVGTIARVGSAIARVGALGGAEAKLIGQLGRAIELNAVPLAILATKGPAGAMEALDEFGGRVLGVKPSVIQQRGIEIVRGGASPDADLLGFLKQVEQAVNGLFSAVSAIEWAPVREALSGLVQAVRALLGGQIKQIEDLFVALSAKPHTVEQPPATQGPSQPPATQPPAKKASGVGWAYTAGAAGAGFVVGGPVGAAVGAGAQLLLKALVGARKEG